MSDRRETSVACAFCSCCCTDLELVIRDRCIKLVYPACSIAGREFCAVDGDPPSLKEGGVPISDQKSLEAICTGLRAARLPLILIGGGVSLESQHSAVLLAKKLSACVDTPISRQNMAFARAFSECGLPSLTLGELRDRVDTVVFWHTDSHQTHPRFWQRFIGENRNRKFISVNCEIPEQTPDSCLHISLDHHQMLAHLVQLRLLQRNKISNVSPVLQELMDTIRDARYGCMVFGESMLEYGYGVLREFFHFIQELNDHGQGRWFGLILDRDVNTRAAADILSLETGYPGAIRFINNKAECRVTEWSGESLIQRGETDLVLQVGRIHDSLQKEIQSRINHFPGKMKYIVLDSNFPPFQPSIWLPVDRFGSEDGGTAMRMDGLPVPIKSILESRKIGLADALNHLIEGVAP